MSFTVRAIDLDRLNSLTKYPSIPTYHSLDPKNGALLEECIPFDALVLLTEKIDGTNARVICLPDSSYIIGSRGELLHAQGDLIANPAMGIVEAVRSVADQLCTDYSEDAITVYFGEVYGGNVTQASKQYTGERRVGFRLFDVARIVNYAEVLERSQSEISEWRESGEQPYLEEEALHEVATRYGLALTPRLGEAESLPTTLVETHAFLTAAITRTHAPLDESGGGAPEGVVVRTRDRSRIAKIRFADYNRTLKRKK